MVCFCSYDGECDQVSGDQTITKSQGRLCVDYGMWLANPVLGVVESLFFLGKVK